MAPCCCSSTIKRLVWEYGDIITDGTELNEEGDMPAGSKRAFTTPTCSLLFLCSCITLCKIFKVVYRQVFCRCVRRMQHVLNSSTTSDWSVCKSVYNPQHHTDYTSPRWGVFVSNHRYIQHVASGAQRWTFDLNK